MRKIAGSQFLIGTKDGGSPSLGGIVLAGIGLAGLVVCGAVLAFLPIYAVMRGRQEGLPIKAHQSRRTCLRELSIIDGEGEATTGTRQSLLAAASTGERSSALSSVNAVILSPLNGV